MSPGSAPWPNPSQMHQLGEQIADEREAEAAAREEIQEQLREHRAEQPRRSSWLPRAFRRLFTRRQD